MVLVLREADVRAVLTMPDTIAVLEAAFRTQAEGGTRHQPRRRVVLPTLVVSCICSPDMYRAYQEIPGPTGQGWLVSKPTLVSEAWSGSLCSCIRARTVACSL